MVSIHDRLNSPASNYATPHVELGPFFRYKYSGFNIGCHAGHLKEETRAIFSQITLPEKA